MTIAVREEQILRIKKASFEPELNEELTKRIKEQVVLTVKEILEESLIEELKVELSKWEGERPRRSGYFKRVTDTLYGRIVELLVPKLRWGNEDREWNILKRYQRAMNNLLDWAGYLYVMGLSLRDLQEALYFLIGSVVSRTAVNRITLQVQEKLESHRQQSIKNSPSILIVDGVWVEVQYTLDKFKIDRAGHQRQCRQAEERVILVAMALWPDGSHQVLHFELAQTEDETQWTTFFAQLIERGLNPNQIELVVSDGSKGLLTAINNQLPNAQQQRCITHKVRGMERYLTYKHLSETEQTASSTASLRKQRWAEIKADAYLIYEAPTYDLAQDILNQFITKWQPFEPKAVHAFLWGIQRTFVFYPFDTVLHIHIRTTNLLERLFREFRSKSDEIGAFPNQTSCLTLFFLVAQREHAKHNRPFVAKT